MTDEEDSMKSSETMKDTYLSATTEEKQKIDAMFIALCGWSMKTLLEGKDNG